VSRRSSGEPLLRAENLEKHYPVAAALPWVKPKAFIRAVDGVSFDIQPRETLSVVGESGCGKTTMGKLVLRLEMPTRGRITFQGHDIYDLSQEALSAYRMAVQAVFQNPFSSLNPRMRVLELIGEPRIVNRNVGRKELQEEVEDLLSAVGLDPTTVHSFPHELSGGMRQRVALARALILRPSLIVLDEPVSALDVSIRAQIMNLLKEVQEQFGVAYLLIAHDLATTRYLSHQVMVMYLGQIAETASSEQLFSRPLHPYTQALISAGTPSRRWERREEIILKGEVPSPIKPPAGCRFHTRCPFVFDRCTTEVPTLRHVTSEHRVACHLY
jgi:oligopeptide/dipeptide ABC transporter ATP-binding protein